MAKHRKIGVESTEMTPESFRAALAAMSYSQLQFAALVGVSPRTAQKWALGETRIPGCVTLLLKIIHDRPELLTVIEEIQPPPIRERRQAK